MNKITIIILIMSFLLINKIKINADEKYVGGQIISTPKGECVSGYNASGIENSIYPDNYLVTAGHCVDQGDVIVDAKTNQVIGQVVFQIYEPG